MHETIDHCWVLDFDRTVGSVEIVMEMVSSICDQLELDFTVLAQEQAEAEAAGLSFVVTEAVERLWPEAYQAFLNSVDAVAHLDCVYTDARIFMDSHEASGEMQVIITFGDVVWQGMKMHLAGLDSTPHIICDNPGKVALLRSCWNGEAFVLPTSEGTVNARTVTLDDDKAAAFESLTSADAIQGICMDRRGVVSNDDVPAQVRLVRSFAEITQPEEVYA